MSDDFALIAWKVERTTEIQDEMAAAGRTSELLWARDCKRLLDRIAALEGQPKDCPGDSGQWEQLQAACETLRGERDDARSQLAATLAGLGREGGETQSTSANWDRTQTAMLAMVDQMSQLHERNPGADFVDAKRELHKAVKVAGGAFGKGSLLRLAATALYAWVVLDEDQS